MLKSLPDARLCLSSCLVVVVNSLLEVVKVLEAEKGKGGWNHVRINVHPDLEVRLWPHLQVRCPRSPRWRLRGPQNHIFASAGTSASLSHVFTHSNYHFKPITAPLMLLLNYSVYSQKMGWCEREIIEVTERGKRWHQIPHRSLTLLLQCPPVIFISHYGWSTDELLFIWIFVAGRVSSNVTGIFSSNLIFTSFRICPLVQSLHIY